MTVSPHPDLFGGRDAFGLPAIAGGPIPDAIVLGLNTLAAGPPLWGSADEWCELIKRMRAWACRWHGPATAAAWSVVQLFGLSAEAPQVRRDLMGGAWLANLHGDRQTTSIDP